MNDLILRTTEDWRSQLKLRVDHQPVWLTQLDMSELFDATEQNIPLHLKKVFQDGGLDRAATVKESLTVQSQGARQADEARAADVQDDAELKALENTLKKRPKPT